MKTIVRMAAEVVVIAGLAVGAAAGLPAQELVIDYRYDLAGAGGGQDYLSFRTPNYLIGVDHDGYDAATGASRAGSTALFGAVYLDMAGQGAFPEGLRGILLFPVAPPATREEDAFHAGKAANGVITLEYAHRGVAYRVTTDKRGRVSLPRGGFQKRTIGSIEGHNPQVILREFSTTETAAGIDWKKVWDPAVTARSAGAIQNDFGALTAMFNWDGELTLTLDANVLTIKGALRIAKR